MFGRTALAFTAFGHLTSAAWPTAPGNSQLVIDPLTYGPELELVHLYYDEFPTGKIDMPSQSP